MGTPNQYDWSKAKPVASEGYNWSQAKPIQAAGAPSPQPKSFMQKVEGVGKGILGMVAAGGSPGAEAVEIGTDPNARRIAEPIAKAALNQLPTAGMVLGGMAGAAGGIETGPGALATGAAGAAAGGVLGKEAQQEIKEHLGISKRPSAKKEAKTLTGTAAMGAASEIGGQLATKVLEKGAAALAPKFASKADELITRLIKPSAARIPEEKQLSHALDISHEVGKFAKGARSLKGLASKVLTAKQGIMSDTERLVSHAADPNAKIPIYDILIDKGSAAIDRMADSNIPNYGKNMDALVQAISDHAGGKAEISPQEAIKLRRWLYSDDLRLPAGTKSFRDDVYHALNDHISQSMSPEDAKAFRANNRSVHRLIKAEKAIGKRLYKGAVSGAKSELSRR